jgi:cytochrome bd-type quinol oxidase subunit 2
MAGGDVIAEVRESYAHHFYPITPRISVAVTIVLALLAYGLYNLVVYPASILDSASFSHAMVFHSIAICLVALVVYITMSVFDLQRHEPVLDFPLHYRALIAVVLGVIAEILSFTGVAGIPEFFMVCALLFTFDITGALYIELLFLPRKLAGAYDSKDIVACTPPFGYVKPFLYKKKDFASYRKMKAPYWLALAGIGSLFISEIIGLVDLWVSLAGPSIFKGWIKYLGLDTKGFLGEILDPHTHMIAIAMIGIVVALAAERFRVLEQTGWQKHVARVGLWVAFASVVAMTVLYFYMAAFNYSPPNLFASGPNGINAMAGDDAVTSFTFIGTLLVLVPLLFTRFKGKLLSRDSIRLSLLGTWFFLIAITIVGGFIIEFNESSFQGTLIAKDNAFSVFQPLFGLFGLTLVGLLLLAVDFYREGHEIERATGWIAGIGLTVASVGGLLWAFVHPATSSWEFAIFTAGTVILAIGGLCSAVVIARARTSGQTFTAIQLSQSEIDELVRGHRAAIASGK